MPISLFAPSILPRSAPRFPIAGALAAAAACFALRADDARACGGCFHSPQEVESTVVTDHRMAFAISPVQSVLWDQIKYSGNPSEFAWVLPVRRGTRIELSQDAWIAALDASTATVITGPTPNCPGAGGAGGCGSANSATFANAGAGSERSVDVVSQQVIGPYDSVTIRSSDGMALGDWLRTNGFAVSTSIQPTIDAYTGEGFDFIALKLRPGFGVNAMQPVRVVTAGADATLPLRMVAAGVGARVGIVLFVLGEGRYHPQNFPDVAVDFSKLTWNGATQQSNYSALAQQAMSAKGGIGWLTESAEPASMAPGSSNPPLETAYRTACTATASTPLVCGRDAGATGKAEGGGEIAEAGDSATDEASDGLATSGDGSSGEGGPSPADDAGVCQSGPACDDLALAMTGISGPLWVTRLRADLPASALASDLVLEAEPTQKVVPSAHQTLVYSDPSYSPCPQGQGRSCTLAGRQRAKTGDKDSAMLGGTAVGLALALGRRQSRQRRKKRSRGTRYPG